MNRLAIACVLGTTILTAASAAQAAERTYLFRLTSGGELRGALQNEGETPRARYVIQTELGIVTLDRDQVVSQDPISESRLEYDRTKASYADTPEGQWKLAQWCSENMLPVEKRLHAERVIELDPSHHDAHALLGHFLDRTTGKWMTQEELRSEQGYVKYNGEWLLPQQVELREEQRKAEEAKNYWLREVARYHRMLEKRDAETARAFLLKITDPAAVPALEPHVRFDKEDNPEIRELYVQSLSSVGSGQALGLLCNVVIADPSEEVRYTAIKEITKHKSPQAVRYFVQQLTANENEKINRAAQALDSIGDLSTVGPLINALVTTHVRSLTEGNPDQVTTTFGPNGANGLTTGSKTQTETRTYHNQAVRDALIHMTGHNDNYDTDAWKKWFAAQTAAAVVDPRRGN